MSEFAPFGAAVNAAFRTMVSLDTDGRSLFVINASGDELWEHYLASYPEGSNPMFRERTEHDCSTCRNFVKNIGGAVLLKDGQLTTVWDSQLSDPVYGVVATAMAAFVRSKSIKAPFVVTEPKYGCLKTFLKNETWSHFGVEVPRNYIARNLPSNVVGNRNDDVAILRRSMEEITDESVDIVLELISQNSLYRGEEHKAAVTLLRNIKAQYNKLTSDEAKERFLWATATPATRIKNTVIGTLLVDLSKGDELEGAVASFEAKVAPTNYKRPTALVTQKMIDQAKAVVEKLDIEDSLQRRYAVKEDISVSNVLFVDGSVKPALLGGAFDAVKPTKKSAPSLNSVETISAADFINRVLPKTSEIELLLQGTHTNNFVSLVAPVHSEAAPLFKWDNGFSWSYDGEVTDSIKERVKRAGGKVDGAMRVSLSWHNGDDLDLHVTRNGRESVYFASRRNFGACLDVDMNAGGANNSTDPVENIVWAKESDIKDGTYSIKVNNYSQRSTSNGGFEIEVEINGQTYFFDHPQVLKHRTTAEVGQIIVKDGVATVSGLTMGSNSREKWGVATNTWVPVELVVRSPNAWDDKVVGNEHVFFMLKGCKNPEGTRGFYNEFLRDELIPHRKTFELLASAMKVSYSDNQLSGVGFSTTKRSEVTLRVKASINRVLNVKF